AGGGLRAGVSGSSRGAAGSGVVFPHSATRRSVARESGVVRIVWRRRGGRSGGWSGSGGSGAADSRHAIGVLSRYGRRNGLGRFRERLFHCTVARSSQRGARTLGRRRGRSAHEAWVQAGRRKE